MVRTALIALLTLLSIWIVVPPVALPVLIADVVAIECSPYLLIANLAMLVWLLVLGRGRRRVAVGLTVWNGALSALPLALLVGHGTTLPPLSPDRAQAVHERTIAVSLGPERSAMRAFLPPCPQACPIVLAIYGGAWTNGEPAKNAQLNRSLASRGYAVFALDYRHAPRYRYPAALDDVRAQLQLILSQAGRYRLDAHRIAVLGHSSGGELGMIAAFARGSPIAAVVSYSGAIDLANGYRFPPQPDPAGVRGLILQFMGQPPEAAPLRYRAASPIAQIHAGIPPVLLIYGTRDHLVDIRSAYALRDALRRAGNDVTWLELPWAEHAFEEVFFGLHAHVAAAAVDAFLTRTLRPKGN